jgi:hypothetical protein
MLRGVAVGKHDLGTTFNLIPHTDPWDNNTKTNI